MFEEYKIMHLLKYIPYSPNMNHKYLNLFDYRFVFQFGTKKYVGI